MAGSFAFQIRLRAARLRHSQAAIEDVDYRRVLDGWINAETNRRINVRPTHWRPWGQEIVGAREPGAMAMSADRRRALRLLAGSPHGCTEAIMLAHGFPLRCWSIL